HVSLSSIFNCQKTDGQNPSKIPYHPTLKSGNKTSVSANFKIFSEPVRRAVRRRLSFGEAAYTATPTNRQQPVFTKVQKIDMVLNVLCFFPLMRIVGGK
ncbi:MAG: hypothetical protein KKH33_02205, partial [Alphaproteobacteria bacterium]|nr:hypothetical protein [Alphaproteobacteria bacterium]